MPTLKPGLHQNPSAEADEINYQGGTKHEEPEKGCLPADGDCDAAEKNGVWYYPILVNHEKASWDEAIATAFDKLQSGQYAEYEAQKKRAFLENLGG